MKKWWSFFVLHAIPSKIIRNKVLDDFCQEFSYSLTLIPCDFFQIWVLWKSRDQRPQTSGSLWKWIQIREHEDCEGCHCLHKTSDDNVRRVSITDLSPGNQSWDRASANCQLGSTDKYVIMYWSWHANYVNMWLLFSKKANYDCDLF